MRFSIVHGLVSVLCFLGIVSFTTDALAQADSSRVSLWKQSLTFSVAGTQSAFQNWKKGGVNSLAITTILAGQAERKGVLWKWHHDLKLALGAVKQDTLNFRKADDQIRYSTSLQYLGDGIFHPTFAAAVETQFLAGFNYDKNPFGDDRTPPVKVSDLFSPAYFTQSFGVTYGPVPQFKVRVGVGTKETVVLIPRLRSLYGVKPDNPIRFELGAESRTDVDWEVASNVRWQSRLSLFAAFNKKELPDALWENHIKMKVNSWLTTQVEFVAYYDRDVSKRIQLKEVLALSIGVTLL